MTQELAEIERIVARQPLLTLCEAKKEIPTGASGFYWIYTNLSVNDLISSPPPTNSVHVDIQGISILHKGLKFVTKQQGENYWCIYNGKGKRLKDRLHAEFSNTDGRTGTLALKRCFNTSDFRVKYVISDSPCLSAKNTTTTVYECLQKDYERLWRLNNEWPILCRT